MGARSRESRGLGGNWRCSGAGAGKALGLALALGPLAGLRALPWPRQRPGLAAAWSLAGLLWRCHRLGLPGALAVATRAASLAQARSAAVRAVTRVTSLVCASSRHSLVATLSVELPRGRRLAHLRGSWAKPLMALL